MAKSLVEKFEQILAADPASMVFVELAKSLLDQGDVDRAAGVCREGVNHHPNSILGRVLLGRALIESAQPEEGQLEFDRALAIDPENPYGYNLVAESLMKARLFEQAKPVLQRALDLQPSDLRLQEWMARVRQGSHAPAGRERAPLPGFGSPLSISPLDRRLALTDDDHTEPALAPLAPPPLPPRSAGSDAGITPDGRGRIAHMLLFDLPEPGLSRPPVPAPTTHTVSEVQRIAENYEQTLREEFEAVKQKPQGVLRRHWLPLTLVATVVTGVLGAAAASRITKKRYGEKHAEDFLSRAKQGLLLDTHASLSGALHQMNEVLESNPHQGGALAVAAQAQAMLCHDFGCSDAERDQAKAWIAEPNASADAETRLAARVYLAGDPAQLDGEVLKVPPQVASPWTHFLAGTALLAKHEEAEALRRFDLGLKVAPAHVPMLLTVAENDLQKADPARASDLFALAHAASALNVGAAVGLAEAHLALHEPVEEDEQNLAAVVAAGPNTVPGALRQRLDFAYARVLAADGKLDKAVALLNDGVSQHGDEFIAYEGALADCYIADGQYDRAETEAWRALSKNKQDPDALARYGEILLARSRAREVLARVLVVQNNRHLHVLRAAAALAAGNLPLSRSEVEATRKDNKVPALAGVLLAEVTAKEGHPAEAKQALRQITTLAHPPAEAFLALAAIEVQAGETQAALADARRAIQVDAHAYEAHCLLGRILIRVSKPDEAEPELLSALRYNQQHVEARLVLGALYLDHGKAKEAAPVLQAAVREAPQDEAANLLLARVLLALGHTDEALRAASRATKAAPQDPKAHHWFGKIALAMGDHKLAIKELKEAKKLDKKDKTISTDLALAEKKKK